MSKIQMTTVVETPQGASVDENGCELDTDGDGIADSLDNCPETVANSTVDDAGCEVVDSTDTGDRLWR